MDVNKFSYDISFDTVHKDTENVIQTIIDEMSVYLGLPPLYQEVYLVFTQEPTTGITDIFSLGIKRRYQNSSLTIILYEDYKEFFEFIFLRELYNLFTPYEVRHYEWIQLIINQMLINDLIYHPLQKEWHDTIREHIEHRESLPLGTSQWLEYDSLNWIFQNSYEIEIDERMININQGAYQFFFHYIRTNPKQLPLEVEYPSNFFFDKYLNLQFRLPRDDEFVETLWCITQIFYNVKTYKNLLEYKTYFKEFKEKGILNTSLSLRKFTAYMERIKYASFISPNYSIVPRSIDLIVLRVNIQFNPLLPQSKVLKVIQSLPFCTSPIFSYISFAINFSAFFSIPRIYQKDFIRFIERLRDDGFVIRVRYLVFEDSKFTTNLNYLKEFVKNRRLVHRSLIRYDEKYEIWTHHRLGGELNPPDLTLLDYLILDLIQLPSASGLGFERRRDTVRRLRDELSTFYQSQEIDLTEFQKALDAILSSSQWTSELIELIENNKQTGFFYLKSYIEDINHCIDILLKLLEHNSTITNLTQLNHMLQTSDTIKSLNTRLLFTNSKLKNIVFHEFIALYFKSMTKFKKRIEQYKTYALLLNYFYNFKPSKLDALKNIIIKQDIKEFIVEERQEKIKQLANKHKFYSLTSQDIEDVITRFLQRIPPVINPYLIGSLGLSENEYHIYMILHDTERVRKILDKTSYIGIFFGIYPYSTHDDEHFIWVILYIPSIPTTYMNLFISTFYRLFGDNLVMIHRSFIELFSNFVTAKSFYDFISKKFFYVQDLYYQLYHYIKKLFGEKLKSQEEQECNYEELYWVSNRSINTCVDQINSFFLRQHLNFELSHLTKLVDFHCNVEKYISNKENLIQAKKEFYFKNFVKSIKFIPNLSKFGLGHYLLYIYSTDLNFLHENKWFKILFTNSFQKIQVPAYIDHTHPLLIHYVFPNGNPNLTCVNWLVESKKNIREFVGFFLQKAHYIFHLDYNLTKNGWDYKGERFNTYVQNILFDPHYAPQLPKIHTYLLSHSSKEHIYPPSSREFQDLIKVYNTKAIDIKSYTGGKRKTYYDAIDRLFSKKLLFPYISFKNLGFYETLQIIIPHITTEHIIIIKKIFSFFNLCVVYETEGEYFIYGFPHNKPKRFEQGLYIKVYFPECDVQSFISVFNKLFEYLGIEYYLILQDMVRCDTLLEAIYGSLNFMKEYNPISNLIWNDTDKKWRNHTLFTQQFQPIYPDLFYGKKVSQEENSKN